MGITGMTGKMAAVSAVALACAAAACAAPPPPAMVRAVSAGVTELRVGETLEIVLEGNASTGYGWAFEDGADGTPQLRQRREAASAAPADEPAGTRPAIGSPTTQRWLFDAVAPGEARIGMHYRRPWETAPPARSVEYRVRVVPAAR